MRKSFRLILAVPLLVFALGVLLRGFPENTFLSVTYEPSSPEIEQLAIATTMTPKAQQLFYKQDPQIASKDTFHSLCSQVQRSTEKTVLLGCFTSNGYRGNIVIQSVTDSRLEGTMEVVAAHELLHAAYQDLSQRERDTLSPKLEQAANRVNDSFLTPVIEAYQEGDREIYFNELHSYLGTELQDLGDPSLENYYQEYFVDRQAIIAFSKQSRRELVKLESQAEQIAADIDGLESNLKYEESELQQTSNRLDDEARALKQMRSDLVRLQRRAESSLRRGDPSLVTDFEIAQERFNTEVRNYNDNVEWHRERVERFNQNYKTYKQKITDYNQLNQNKRDIIDTLKLDSPELDMAPVSSQ